MSDRLTLPLECKLDANGNKYYIAKLRSPIKIDCENGAAFMVFVSEPGSEELQIGNITTKSKDRVYKKDDGSNGSE